jgi:hypothetical protein
MGRLSLDKDGLNALLEKAKSSKDPLQQVCFTAAGMFGEGKTICTSCITVLSPSQVLEALCCVGNEAGAREGLFEALREAQTHVREWLPDGQPAADDKDTLSVMTYNVLPPQAGVPAAFPDVPREDLCWETRMRMIVRCVHLLTNATEL